MRTRLPETREGIIHKLVIYSDQGDVDMYITINRYPDNGSIAEIFVDVGKQGTTLQAMLDGWAIQTSVALQYGVPIEVIMDKFRGTSFPPSGPVKGLDIGECSSLFDLIVRVLEREIISANGAEMTRQLAP